LLIVCSLLVEMPLQNGAPTAGESARRGNLSLPCWKSTFTSAELLTSGDRLRPMVGPKKV
jgi:hypothetical protein